MKGFAYFLVAVVALTGVLAYMAHASGRSDGEADPVLLSSNCFAPALLVGSHG